MEPKEFVKSLKQCENFTNNQKIFGLPWILWNFTKSFIEKENGVFLSIFRNPLNKVISMFESFGDEYLTNGLVKTNSSYLSYKYMGELKDELNKNFDSILEQKFNFKKQSLKL